MAKWLALSTSDHEVLGSNPSGGGIQLMTVWCFTAESLSLSPIHYPCCRLVLFCSCVFQSFEHCDYLAWGRDAFCTFVQFALVWFCLFPLPLGVWEGLRLVIVALPGLSSYLFLAHLSCSDKVCFCDHILFIVRHFKNLLVRNHLTDFSIT